MLPADTDAGVAELVVTRSDWPAAATVSFAVAVLFADFGSATPEPTLTVSLIRVPAAVPPFTVTVKTMFPGVLGASDGLVQVRVPRLQVHPPPGPVNEKAVVLAGNVSVTVTPVAVLGPALFTVWV